MLPSIIFTIFSTGWQKVAYMMPLYPPTSPRSPRTQAARTGIVSQSMPQYILTFAPFVLRQDGVWVFNLI